jgi:hypothetical protein
LKVASENRTKTYILGGIIAVAVLAAGYFYFSSRREPAPDKATVAASEKLDQMQSQSKPPAPPAEIPLEKRAARGAVAPK